jgi:hypothetical protein
MDLRLEVFVPKKKEIAAAAGGWGDWMDGKSFTTMTSFTI